MVETVKRQTLDYKDAKSETVLKYRRPLQKFNSRKTKTVDMKEEWLSDKNVKIILFLEDVDSRAGKKRKQPAKKTSYMLQQNLKNIDEKSGGFFKTSF